MGLCTLLSLLRCWGIGALHWELVLTTGGQCLLLRVYDYHWGLSSLLGANARHGGSMLTSGG